MPFEPFRFLINRAVIENQGVESDRAAQLALVPSVLNVSMAESLVVATVVGRNNATPASTGASDAVAEVPRLLGENVDKAEGILTGMGLTVSVELMLSDRVGIVLAQEPAGPVKVPVGSTVKLTVGESDQPPPP